MARPPIAPPRATPVSTSTWSSPYNSTRSWIAWGAGAARVRAPDINPERPGPRTLTGRCLCGAVEYRVADEFVYAAHCHCSNCRRTTGAAFKSFAGIEREKLSLARGEGSLMRYGDGLDGDGDLHCKTCGSLLYSVVQQGARVHVALGTLV